MHIIEQIHLKMLGIYVTILFGKIYIIFKKLNQEYTFFFIYLYSWKLICALFIFNVLYDSKRKFPRIAWEVFIYFIYNFMTFSIYFKD